MCGGDGCVVVMGVWWSIIIFISSPTAASNSLGLLNVIGSSLGARCWLQARVFPDAGQETPPNSIITMEQTVIISNMIILVRFNTYSGAGQTSVNNLASNAVCSPTVCEDIRTGSLVARDISTNMRHIPIPFDDTTFDSVENGPLIISTEFVYDELILATSTRPRPFYPDLASCMAQGQETDAASSSSDYFSFQDVNQFEMPVSTGRSALYLYVVSTLPLAKPWLHFM